MNKTIYLILIAFIINLPFGYMRAKSRKFSTAWFLYIHIPVPFIIAARWILGLGILAIPFSLTADIAGQLVGGKFYQKKKQNNTPHV